MTVIDEKTISVPVDVIPCRIDIYLVQQGVGLSRSQIQKLIHSGNIKVIGKGTKPNFLLKGGEIINIKMPDEQVPLLMPEDIPIDIIYEDEHLLIVNKPPGMVTHPGRSNWSGTLINAIVHHTKQLSPIGGDFRPGIVHRLDQNTSGLLIIAKRAPVHLRLAGMLSRHEISRKYLALIWGHLAADIQDIDAPIGRNPKEATKRAVVDGGRNARTQFERLARFDFLDFVEARLFTGRTHQIRVHAQHIGHPVFGDKEYGGREARLGGVAPQFRAMAKKLLDMTSRQMLHAWKLSFVHPVSEKGVSFCAPLPDDFRAVMNELGDKIFCAKF